MRISAENLVIITSAFKQYFTNDDDHLWLFGSRVDDNKRGGDLDFYIETVEPNVKLAVNKEFAFVNELCRKLGDQKIDVVLNMLISNYSLPIYEIARTQGVKLI